MKPLSENDIEADLSYCYLRAVAAKAGMSCSEASRHLDNAGIDATITAWGSFPPSYKTEVDFKVQLKATVKAPGESSNHWSYFLAGVQRYDDLRSQTSTPRILVVLFLDGKPEEWLKLTPDQMTLKKCAYWCSLRGAPESDNKSGQTIYLPKVNLVTPESLTEFVRQVANSSVPDYVIPS